MQYAFLIKGHKLENIDKDSIKEFWKNRSKHIKNGQTLTHNDIWQRWLEIELISSFIPENSRIIDIGCGNGYTTNIIAPLSKDIIGIDYCDEMIQRAEMDYPDVRFCVVDVMCLRPEDFGMFDVAISERCLINLTSWEDQKKAISNIASVIKCGGLLLFVEGSKHGRDNLNSMRTSMGLSPMPSVWHNLDFSEPELVDYLEKFFMIEKKLYFGVYDFISRVVHPMIIFPDEPRYDAKINETAARLSLNRQEFSNISRTLFFVLKKK